ncbi:MAG: hypothetical protein ACREA9_04395 [Pyrinomonadaceae bacterium]
MNTAARAGKGVSGRVGPTGEGQRGRLLWLALANFWRPMLRFSVGRTAMFAKPTVTEIEKVVCLIH